AGCNVTVYESGHQAGGRARPVYSPNLSYAVDNGQHILLGAYTNTLGLMQLCDASAASRLHREPLCLATPNNAFHFCLPHWPHGRIGRLAGLLVAKGLSLRDKYSLARALFKLEQSQWQIPPSTPTLSQWLQSQKQT